MGLEETNHLYQLFLLGGEDFWGDKLTYWVA